LPSHTPIDVYIVVIKMNILYFPALQCKLRTFSTWLSSRHDWLLITDVSDCEGK